jgi:hypothetical protein
VKRLWLDTGSIVTAPINIVRLINQHIIIGNATHNHNVGIDSSRALYYKETKTISQIEFCSDSIARNTLYGKFPSSYTKDNLNFYNWFPSISETSSTEILVTYARDDSIYLYNNTKLIKSRLCKSKYIDEFIPLTEKQGFDRAYSISYQWHEPRYLDVIYNKYRDTYYRLVKHKDVLINENKVDMEQSTWSIIVMDSDLNVIHEYVLNRNEYSFMYAFPCAKGLYVKNATSKTDKRFKLTLLDI